RSSASDILGFAGRSGGTNSYRERNVYRYNVGNDSWTNVGMMAAALDGPESLKLWDGRIAISGGSKQDAPHDFSKDVQIENNNVWSTVAQMQRERHHASIAQWTTDTIMTLGGFNNADATMNTTDWVNITT